MSPKSNGIEMVDEQILETSSNLNIDALKFVTETTQMSNHNGLHEESVSHTRIERSASPILNEIPSKSSIIFEKLQHLDANEDTAGRYYNYDINPTKIQSDSEEFDKTEATELFQREGKSFDSESFLSKRGPRLESGSPNKVSNATLMESIVLANKTGFNNPRQQQNPDIQDIITGIVKLLNGNVNVHANTQTSRRPLPSRINNRGPPRISEVQPIQNDYDIIGTSSIRPPPYPFERPDGPVRPFLTGVPIPEQIVPSMQQNYRPGFVSQNRPPWQRPRPRPPIHDHRRPYPYKPLPPHQPDYHFEEEVHLTTLQSADQDDLLENSTAPYPIDNNHYETEEHVDEHVNDDRNEENEEDNDNENIKPTQTSEVYTSTTFVKKKEEFTKKKDKNPNKSSEKKPIIPIQQTTTTSFEIASPIDPTTTVTSTQTEMVTTIIESISEVNTVENNIPTHIDELHASTVDHNQNYAQETTPTLEPSSPSVISTSIYSSTSTIEVTSTPTTTNIKISSVTPSTPYHPRPGIVLDDPEFKPGGNRGGQAQQQQQQQRPRLPIQV